MSIEIPKEIKPIKSILRYPGGKSKAIDKIIKMIPEQFGEFREPMVGGGSVFLTLKQIYPHRVYWINDINKDLYLFWKTCKKDGLQFEQDLQKLKKKYRNGKRLYQSMLEQKSTDYENAVRFFVLNRVTFSGLMESGGYSDESFRKRLTYTAIEKIKKVSEIMHSTRITNEDYESVINAPGDDVFIFLDPPYFSNTNSKLYGKKGSLHSTFDHKRLAKIMETCKHKWLITYDDSPEIRKLYHFAYIVPWELQYGMNNYKKKFAKKGKEIFISNYNPSYI